MKSHRFAWSLLAAVLAVSPLFAQSEPKESAPTEVLGITALYVDPITQVRDFFRQLCEGRVDAAYDQLLRGTKFTENPKSVLPLKERTRDAIREFGEINGFKIAGIKNIGQGAHLMSLTCISFGKKHPMRWRFYFYNPNFKLVFPEDGDPAIVNGTWKLIDIRMDDRVIDSFEEMPSNKGDSVK